MKLIQRTALLLFFFSINFEMWDPSGSGQFSISKFTGLIYLGVMLPSIIQFKTPKEYKPVLWPVWLFFILLTVISFFHLQPGFTKYVDITILQNIILFWILINHEKQEHLVLEKGILSFALGAFVLAVLFNLGIGIEIDPTDYRTSIFGDNANNVGVRMSIALAVIPVSIIQNRLELGKIRYLFLLSLPLIFSTMLDTGSRVAFIAFLLSYITFVVLYKSETKWGKPVMILSGVFVFLLILMVLLKSELITERLVQTIKEGDLSDRDIIWKRVLPIWWENPLFGVGKTGYEHIVWTASGRYVSPHNVILEILCLTGVAGLFFYSLFLYRVVQTSFQFYNYSGFILPLLLFIPMFGLLLSAQLLPVKIGWCIFAYIAGSKIYLPQKSKSINPLIYENSLRY